MRQLLYPPFVGGRGSVGLLLVRVVTGLAFMLHGWPKIVRDGEFVMFGWMPPQAHIPAVLQGLAACSEFVGGLALILGLLTPLATLGLACTMFVALGLVHLPAGDPFVAARGGRSFELAADYLAIVVLLMLLGPGKLSLDAWLFGRRTPAPSRRLPEPDFAMME